MFWMLVIAVKAYRPLAVCANPPLTEANRPLALFESPPVTEANGPEIVLSWGPTKPPNLE